MLVLPQGGEQGVNGMAPSWRDDYCLRGWWGGMKAYLGVFE